MEYGNFEAEISREVLLNHLPVRSIIWLSQNFSGEKIMEVSVVTHARNNKTIEVEVKDQDLICDSPLYIRASGRVVKKRTLFK